MTDKICVALFDDHPLMREGIVNALNYESGFEIVAEGATKDEAVEAALRELPDIILLDISMPGGGIEAAQEISALCPVIGVVMLTVSEDEENVSAALRAGAHGYIIKGVSGLELIRTLRAVHDGYDYISPGLAARLLTQLKQEKDGEQKDTDLFSDITAREEQILAQVAIGLSNEEVGEKLEISEKTVKHYMTNILQKLQVRNRVEAVLVALRESDGDTK